jgi:DNA-binding transcriptional MerR regulator
MSLLSTKQVATLLNCTPRNVQLLVKKGKLTPINPQKEFYLFDANQVEMFNSKTVKQ